ncbi:acyltransferase [Streptomyces sp. NBC_01136]|uniref:acyltransferase n=1 Tax=unclassified Streptomyces TaxID=2593676 RepID=UPI0032501197|nr:acyltransferase [Streptomyces sp. NBC_01136]WST81154.1 acyltransferase [Streptomyces sp. NBC_01136]
MNLRSASPRTHRHTVTVRAGEATGERVRLGVYDLMTGTFATLRTFYYRQALDAEALRASLAATLAHYPLLTGRLVRDADRGLSVVCNDAGALFTESHCDRPMPEYGPDRSAKPDLRSYIHGVNPFRIVGHDTPLLTVRITHMRGGGSVLGIAINHSIVDGSGYLDFLRHWSSVHHGLEHRAAPYARTLLDGVADGAAPGTQEHSTQYVLVPGRKKFGFIWRVNTRSRRVRTITLRFAADEVRALKEHALAGLAGRGLVPSTGDALSAHLWKVLAELRARPDHSIERLGMVVGLRSVLRERIPDGFWGNAVTNVTPALPAGDLRGAPLSDTVAAVREAVSSVTVDRVRDEVAFLEAQRRARRAHRVLSRMSLDAFEGTIALNNVSRLPVYEIDLGAGRPFWFEYPASTVPWTLLVTPTPVADGSRDVHFSVPREIAEALVTPEWTKRLHAYAPRG